MPVLQSGSVNLSALTVDNVYIVIVQPASTMIQGVDTGVVGLVGGAAWGPLNTPVTLGSPQDTRTVFGPLTINPRDLCTDALNVMQQGVSTVVGVRVSDGTDVKATYALQTAAAATVTIGGVVHTGDVVTVTYAGTAVPYTVLPTDTTLALVAAGVANALNSNGTFAAVAQASVNGVVVTVLSKSAANTPTLTAAVTGSGATVTATASGATVTGGGTAIGTFTAMYSGTEGNTITAYLAPNARYSPTNLVWDLSLVRSGIVNQSESFFALPQASLAAAITAAVANGQGPGFPASKLATFTGAGTGAPVQATVAFSGGTNGDTGITTNQQVGTNIGFVPTGMYALQSQGIGQFGLCGNTDTMSWAAQLAFAQTAGALAVVAFPAGTNAVAAIAAKLTAAIDSPYMACVMGWVQFNDTYNKQLRLVSPVGHALGRIASLTYEQSPENKPINGITATERTLAQQPFTDAEMSALNKAGITFIANNNPGGSFFGLRNGLNASSNNAENGIEYTRTTNFLAYSLNAAFGEFIGLNQTTRANDPLRNRAQVKLQNFGLGEVNAGRLDAWAVDMSFGNVNTVASIQAGYMKANVSATYMNVVRYFVVALMGGKTVSVTPVAA